MIQPLGKRSLDSLDFAIRTQVDPAIVQTAHPFDIVVHHHAVAVLILVGFFRLPKLTQGILEEGKHAGTSLDLADHSRDEMRLVSHPVIGGRDLDHFTELFPPGRLHPNEVSVDQPGQTRISSEPSQEIVTNRENHPHPAIRMPRQFDERLNKLKNRRGIFSSGQGKDLFELVDEKQPGNRRCRRATPEALENERGWLPRLGDHILGQTCVVQCFFQGSQRDLLPGSSR